MSNIIKYTKKNSWYIAKEVCSHPLDASKEDIEKHSTLYSLEGPDPHNNYDYMLKAAAPALLRELAKTILSCAACTELGIDDGDTLESIIKDFVTGDYPTQFIVIAAALGCELEQVTLEVLEELTK